MEQHLKKRILGAFVTVVAIAVTLPMVLDGSRQESVSPIVLPTMPETAEGGYVDDERRVRIELEQLASGDAEARIAVPETRVVMQDDAQPPGTRVDRTSLDTDGIPYAWTLQLGAFSDAHNANALRDKLRAKGYKAYTQTFPSDNLTRVYVGPEVQRSEIEAQQQKLIQQLGQKDIHIKRYRAES